MNVNNGDMPASPLPSADLGLGGDDLGLTKLEHFVGMAMQGLCANSHLMEEVCKNTGNPEDVISNMAVKMAVKALDKVEEYNAGIAAGKEL